jgi:hypothetical protein
VEIGIEVCRSVHAQSERSDVQMIGAVMTYKKNICGVPVATTINLVLFLIVFGCLRGTPVLATRIPLNMAC